MPIIDIPQPLLSDIVDTPKGFAITPGKNDVDHGSDAPSFGSVIGASFRRDNMVGGFLSSEERDSPTFQQPGFNAWEKIKGTKYEPYAETFGEIRNDQAFANHVLQIDRENEDRKLIEAAPWYQKFPAAVIAGGVDLPTLLPGGTFVRGIKGGFSIARSAANVALSVGASSALQEIGLHETQTTRTAAESATNIGASIFLGGLLGVGGAKLLSNAEWNSSVALIERELSGVSRETSAVPETGQAGSTGAAATRPASLEDNTIYGKAAGSMAAATAQLNPLLRALTSPSAAWRDISTKLFENSLYLKKNVEGIASEPAVETFMKEWNGGLAKSIRSTEDSFQAYAKRGGAMTHSEFNSAVGRAMRRGDESEIPEVASVAKVWRSQVFDPLKDAAIEAKLLPPDVSVDTATSYLSRMWNRNKLIAQEGAFKQVVSEWVEKNAPRWEFGFDKETAVTSAKLDGAERANYLTKRLIERDERFGDADAVRQMGREIGDNVFNTLTGKTEPVARPEFATVGARGPLKERTFSIPDHLIEDFLEDDIREVGQRYVRVMGADVELVKKFGSVDLKEQIQAIRNDYAKLRSGLTDEKQLSDLAAREKADIRDLEGVRDLLRGTRNVSTVEQNYARIVRSANSINYLRSMGEVVLASLTDAVRPAMVHGLRAYMETVGQLATNMQAIKFSVAEAQLAGNVTERVLGQRFATLAEISDPYAARGPMERFLENMTNVASKWNGIRLWTDGMKSLAFVMTQNRILGNVTDFANIKPIEKTYLAYLGIDESMVGRLAEQFAKHGENVDGVHVANTEKWDDAVAVRGYRAAINKDVDSIIVQPSRADLPLFASTPTGKAILQFKSFALASNQRILLRGLQEDQSRFVGGVVAMTAMGMLTTYLKAISGNREEKLQDFIKNPGWWIAEGFDRAGIVAIPVELSNMFEKATGFNPIKTPIKSGDEGSAISQKLQNRSLLGTLVGPSAGLVDDLTSTAGIPNRIAKGEEISQGQKNAAERLLPFNSYLGVRQMLRYVINPQNP